MYESTDAAMLGPDLTEGLSLRLGTQLGLHYGLQFRGAGWCLCSYEDRYPSEETLLLPNTRYVIPVPLSNPLKPTKSNTGLVALFNGPSP